eukprot:144177-Pleurochrysis_carterae.AAC.1
MQTQTQIRTQPHASTDTTFSKFRTRTLGTRYVAYNMRHTLSHAHAHEPPRALRVLTKRAPARTSL